MYNPSSLNAEEFICHDEALASIAYASENRNNLGLVDLHHRKGGTKERGSLIAKHPFFWPAMCRKRFRKSMRWLSGSNRISTATAS